MKNQLTIIGLGQIGASFGMALGKYQDEITRIGHDKSRSVAKQAKSQGAVDKITITLSGAVSEADLIILALPLHEIRETLEHIAADLQPGTLVIDTAPIKRPVIEWMDALLPEGCSYVGLIPALQADYLEENIFGVETAHQDLFAGCQMAVVSGNQSPTEAIQAATNLVGLVGADPFFADAAEIDGLMGMTHVLPQLVAASLLRITQDAPGWRDARKISGKAFTQTTLPLVPDDIPEALASAAVHNKENTVRLLDDLIRELVSLRDDTQEDNQEELAEKFIRMQQGRDLWWQDRQKNNWSDFSSPAIPQRSMLADLLGFKTFSRKKDDADS